MHIGICHCYKRFQLLHFGPDEHYINLSLVATVLYLITAEIPITLLPFTQQCKPHYGKHLTCSLNLLVYKRRCLFGFTESLYYILLTLLGSVSELKVYFASRLLWNAVTYDTNGALLLTLDPWKLFSVLQPGLMDKAESIDAPSPETLISLSLFLSMLLLGLIDSVQWMLSDCLISVTSKPGRGENIDLFANNGNVSASGACVGHANILYTQSIWRTSAVLITASTIYKINNNYSTRKSKWKVKQHWNLFLTKSIKYVYIIFWVSSSTVHSIQVFWRWQV